MKPKAIISVVPLGLWGLSQGLQSPIGTTDIITSGFIPMRIKQGSWVETQGNGIGRPAGTFGFIIRITKSQRDERYHNFGIYPDEVKTRHNFGIHPDEIKQDITSGYIPMR